MASQYRRRSLMLNTIAKVAQGNPTIITDSSSRRLQKLNVYGQSSQDGTPTPETPVEIISKEVSEIKVTGKNLANIQEFEKVYAGNTFEAHYEDDKITYSEADDWSGCGIALNQTFKKGQYMIQAKGVVMLFSDIALPNFEYNEYWNGKGYPYIYKFTQLNPKVSFNSDFPFKIGFIGGDINTGKSTVSGTIEQFQIELSSEATSYEPYKSQTITLSPPITLRGIPVDNGGNVTIDGKQYIADYIDSLTSKVNRLNGYIDSYNGEEVGTIFMSTTGQLTTGAKVIYKLSQPTQEDLPQQDQEAIRKLKTFYPNTVIQTGCWNEVTYSAKRGG